MLLNGSKRSTKSLPPSFAFFLSYQRLLDACDTLNINLLQKGPLQPIGVCLDGDKGAYAAAKKKWPSVEITRCIAHIERNVVENWPHLYATSIAQKHKDEGPRIVATYRKYANELRARVCRVLRLALFAPTFAEYKLAKKMFADTLRSLEEDAGDVSAYLHKITDDA